MAATLNLRMETSAEQLVFINLQDNAKPMIRLAISDGEAISEAVMDTHEIDMLIAFLQAGKAQLRQTKLEG